MKRLNELIARVDKMASEGVRVLYPTLRSFFSQQKVQELLIRYNQEQMFDFSANREGRVLGNYSVQTSMWKRSIGLPYSEFTFYETGSFYASMGVDVGEEGVAITSSSKGLGLDFAMDDLPATIEMSHINDMFSKYDPNRKALGLHDDNFVNFVETSGIKEYLITGLDNYLDGKNTD